MEREERVVKFFGNMRSFFRGKLWLVLLASIALGAIAILASGLRQLSFRSGQVLLGREQARPVGQPLVEIVRELGETPLWKHLVVWGVLFLIVVLISMVLSPELRRWLIRIFLRLVLTAMVIFLIARRFSELSKEQELFAIPTGLGAPSPPEAQPLPVFQPPHLSPLFIFLAGLVVAACFGAVLWSAQRWWQRREAALALRKPVEELGDIARDSLDRLSAGGSWDDVIMESYVRMSQVVGQRRGLIRRADMTPGEFALRLQTAGLPAEAVHTLTRLFEKVRYGARAPSPEETGEAVRSLTAILDYCRGSR
jgi:hypothetical protein